MCIYIYIFLLSFHSLRRLFDSSSQTVRQHNVNLSTFIKTTTTDILLLLLLPPLRIREVPILIIIWRWWVHSNFKIFFIATAGVPWRKVIGITVIDFTIQALLMFG